MKSFTHFILLIAFCLPGCSSSGETLNAVFTENELKEINTIIHFYDEFVKTKTKQDRPIHKRYELFLERYCQKALKENRIDFLFPEYHKRIMLYDSLKVNAISNLIQVKDSVECLDQTGSIYKIHRPYTVQLSFNGKFLDFLKELSSKNKYYDKIRKQVSEAYTISPSTTAMLLTEYKNINFKRKDERLVFILSMLYLADR